MTTTSLRRRLLRASQKYPPDLQDALSCLSIMREDDVAAYWARQKHPIYHRPYTGDELIRILLETTAR